MVCCAPSIVNALLVYGGVVLGIATGWLVLAPRAVLTAVGLAVAYFVLPFDLMTASFLDMRVAVMLGFLLFAAVDPARRSAGDAHRGKPSRCFWYQYPILATVCRRFVMHAFPPAIARAYRAAAAACAVLFAVRMAVVAVAWSDHRRDLAELRAVIATVPPGAKVYFTNVPRDEAPAYWNAGPLSRRLSNTLRTDYHLPALLLIERGAFWPVLFANPAQQPIRLRPAYARLAREARAIPSHASLVLDPDRALPALRDFDFVLVLEAGADPDLAHFIPRCLTLVSRADFAALFRVMRDSPKCATRTGFQ